MLGVAAAARRRLALGVATARTGVARPRYLADSVVPSTTLPVPRRGMADEGEGSVESSEIPEEWDPEYLKTYYDYGMIEPRTPPHMKLGSTAPGEPRTTALEEKYSKDTFGRMYNKYSGFDDFAKEGSLIDPLGVESFDPFNRQYRRDEEGNATLPERYKNVDLAGLDKALQKADHYFFGDNIPPHLMVYDDEAADDEDEPAILMKKSWDDDEVQGLATVMSSDLLSQDPNGLAQHMLDSVYKSEEYLRDHPDIHPGVAIPRAFNVDRYRNLYAKDNYDFDFTETDWMTEQQLDPSNIDQFTARERRLEFWGKFIQQMTYFLCYTEGVNQCTKASGRINSFYVVSVMCNEKGVLAWGRGKAATRDRALTRAMFVSPRNMMYVPLFENRTLFKSAVVRFKRTTLVAHPRPRGFGLNVPDGMLKLLYTLGFRDMTIKVHGARKDFNVLMALLKVFEMQESYRETAMRRGVHYETFMNPFYKNPPKPTRMELDKMEKDASEKFDHAVREVLYNRDLLKTDTFREMEQHVTQRDEWKEKWTEFMDAQNVPRPLQRYPPFSEFLDAQRAMPKIMDEWTPSAKDLVDKSTTS